MAYKDLAQQRAYQQRWVATKRQRMRQPAGVPSPTPPTTTSMTPAQATSPPPLTAWATQVQALPAACDAAMRMLRQLEPGLMRDAIAGRCLAPVSEVQILVTRSQASLQQAAEALAELNACRRRLLQVMPAK